MLASFNAEWLAWTVKASLKILFHDQKMAEQKREEGKMAIKGGGGQEREGWKNEREEV